MGLSLAYAITLTGMFQYCVRTSAEVENLVRKPVFISGLLGGKFAPKITVPPSLVNQPLFLRGWFTTLKFPPNIMSDLVKQF